MMSDATSAAATLLLVDDDANILAALRRLFDPLGYRVLTAESGPAALALMEQHRVDLVISDMRMPRMNGAEELAQIRARWPEVVRILLTGYADLDATVSAINRGEIYRYIAKPWDDQELVVIVREALERKALQAEKRALEELTARQNEALKALNAELEDKVLQRTQALQETMLSLDDALRKLQQGYLTSIEVFANLMELRTGKSAGHSRRVAALCRDVARNMGMAAAEQRDLEVAALLHNIGKIGLPDHLLDRPYSELSYAERMEFEKHPAKGAAALMALDELQGATRLIQSHHEHFDGQGYPAGLKGYSIPLGARILLVCSDYEALLSGGLGPERLDSRQALHMISAARGTRYDPAVIDVLQGVLEGTPEAGEVVQEFQVKSAQLHEGQLLTRDVESQDGMLLLMKNTVLNAALIRQIEDFEKLDGRRLSIYIRSM